VDCQIIGVDATTKIGTGAIAPLDRMV
jgi:hypothetical protein